MVKPAPCATIDWSHSLSLGLQQYWLLAEGGGKIAGNLIDSSYYGSLSSGGATWKPGRFGSCVNLSGSSSSIDISKSKASFSDAQSHTYSCWIYQTGSYDYSYGWIFHLANSDTIRGTGIALSNANQLYFWYNGQGSGLASGFTVPASKWIHLVSSYSGVTKKATLYANGLQVYQSSALSFAYVPLSTDIYRIGRSCGGAYNFPGSIDNVRVYSRALANNEVAALYADPFAGIAPAGRRYFGVFAPSINGAAAINLGISLSAAGSDPVAGAAAIGLGLGLSAAGSDPVAGAAAIGLGLALAGTGSNPVAGAAAIAMSLSLSAAGSDPVAGASAIVLGLGLSVTGTNLVSGAATIGLGLSLVGAGVDPVAGAAAIAMGLTLAGAGSNPAAGAAAVDIGFSLSATGTNASPVLGAAAIVLGLTLASAGNVPATGAAAIALGLALSGIGLVIATAPAACFSQVRFPFQIETEVRMSVSALASTIVELLAIFTSDGDPADPSTVTLRIKDPAAAITSRTPAKVSTGVYRYRFDTQGQAAGIWSYRWEGDGGVDVAAEGTFTVQAAAF